VAPEERAAAAFALGTLMFQAAEAVPIWQKISTDDPDKEVRENARVALLNIRGFVPAPKEF
jgi:hypothetical protein